MAGKSRGLPKHLYHLKGRFVARLVVPERLREIVGASQFSKALGPDRVAAERALPGVVATFYAKIDEAERKLAPETPRDAEPPRRLSPVEMARILYDEQVARDRAERDGGTRIPMTLFEAGYFDVLRRTVSAEATSEEMDGVLGWAIDDFRHRGFHGETFGKPQWRMLARTLARAELEYMRYRSALDRGEAPAAPTDPVVVLEVVPATTTGNVVPLRSGDGGSEATRLTNLFKDYMKERKVAGGGHESERRWEPVFRNIHEFMRAQGRKDDANTMTKSDFVAWKEHLIASGLSMKTIKDVYLASVKAVVRWAHENDKIENNFASTVRVKAPKRQLDREQGHTLDEAKQILAAALHHRPVDTGNPQTTEGKYLTAAKKWAPWLAAHAGARISEITQLRKQDVVKKDGVYCIMVTPDAGSVKNSKYRYVPLHKQIIDMGFLDFVEKSSGALFFDDSIVTKAKTPRSRFVAGRISDWLRAKKVGSPDVQPNHGWRHRFKTLARELGLDPRVVDAIQGHATRTASDDYGDVTIKACKRAIDMMPSYDVK